MLFTKGAESAILPHATGGEIEKTRLHVDEFALVRYIFFNTIVDSRSVCSAVQKFLILVSHCICCPKIE